MNNIIQNTLFDIWQSRPGTKKSSGGWWSNNAVCCIHRGESQDKRRRGGVKEDGDAISYHCFNCGFSTGYRVGGPLGVKFQALLRWLDVSEIMIDHLKFESFKISHENGYIKDINDPTGQIVENLLKITEIPLPKNSIPLNDVINNNKYKNHVDYILSRGLTLTSYPYLVSDEMPDRVILPFIRQQTIVGYTSRSITNKFPKYLMQMGSPYVFGLDLQEANWNWVIASEGPFDALSIDGIAFLGREVSEEQSILVNRLRRKIIVVPDNDKDGLDLVRAAIDYKWNVSFPNWDIGIKDINQAVQVYGKLLVIRQILANLTDNETEIKIRLGLLSARLNKNNV